MTDASDSGSGPVAEGPEAGQSQSPGVIAWVTRAVAAAGLLVVLWVLLTAWPVVVHGHPLYAVLLTITLALSVYVGLSTRRPLSERRRRRRVLRILLIGASVAAIGVVAWLKPFTAQEPALAAMASDPKVTVAEYPTQIVLTPTATPSTTALFFQPGARVDARAYAAVLRPVAEAGHVVVIAKQPVGIAFLATTAFESARAAYPDVTRWIVGGHSLAGTVAAIDADDHDSDATAPVVGLLLYASYPATDMSSSLTADVLSISGSEDGLATPAKIDASRADLPRGTTYTVVEGGVHAFFGDYGPQPGDGTPTITHDAARTQISSASLDRVATLSR
ncbi:MAG TPA: alpha/beta hydrolase [Candidatus Nanopelagicales bacterium]